MQSPRFYVSGEELGVEITASTSLPVRVNLRGSAVKHMTQVLRLKEGAAIVIFNGCGCEFRSVIRSVGKNSVEIEVVDVLSPQLESPTGITLAQGVSRADRMDWTVQKSVELGVNNIIPVITARTVVNLKGEHKQRRVQHWRKVAISACEQCGRNYVPEVSSAVRFSDFVSQFTCAEFNNVLKLVLYHKAESGLSSVIKQRKDSPGSVLLLVGPEGGLSEQEQQDCVKAGFIAVKMGPRILRTETAAIAAITLVQSTLGDLG